ncbi:MAG TPA: chemotaxis response regulator protein-glutamate methylesterase [bacterium]|nr:chemotaxis response regulator protein-glutamate methylesterase [bacterium]
MASVPSLIRVLVVDDSFFMRKILVKMLDDPQQGITVVDTAKNGLEAIEKSKALKPDVITLDVEMPHMDGLTALRRILVENPTPVIMLSAHTGKGTETTIKALEIGAVDCLGKPSGIPITDLESIRAELLEKVRLASATHPPKRSEAENSPAAARRSAKVKADPATRAVSAPAHTLVAVASSTGGPRALQELLSQIPEGFPAALVLVQHISTGFTKALAKRLDECGGLTVVEAEEGQPLLTGFAYVAPAGRHLTVQGGPGNYRAALNDSAPRMGVRPSADVMMQSVAKASGKHCLGVVLTGMGRDGAAGLKEIRAGGGRTYAQDAGSCVVYGMPKAAVELGAVDQQLPVARIAEEIVSFLSR